MAFLGKDLVRCKIVVDNKCAQKWRIFKYLGFEISVKIKNIQKKLPKHWKF